jgi:NAD-reducing hydrogenase large subunit
MSRIVIDPVSRIEGHAKISIYLDEAGQVADARFHVTEFRGFEKFCEGRPFHEMPGLTARICGICPVSHLLCSAKAGDAILGIRPPSSAIKLRQLMNLGQIIQSHALSFFHLSSPDLFLGFDHEPASRNVFGLIRTRPELARAGIRLRQFGQEIIEKLGGRKIHPAWAVPGGVRSAPTEEVCREILTRIPEVHQIARMGLDLLKAYLDSHAEEPQVYGNFPTLYMALVRPDDHGWEHHDGVLRIMDHTGKVICDDIDPAHYQDHLAEYVEHDSYLKSPYYRAFGYPYGIYRVGPLARLNVCTRIGTPRADAELAEFRHRAGGTVANSAFLYHLARLIEILASIELIERLLDDPDIRATRHRFEAGINYLEGIGCSEAPRGTLFHHYRVTEHGQLIYVNLIIATGQNNLAMNRTVAQLARYFIKDTATIPEGLLNRIEHGIRCYDPCLSCSTHAFGQMPLQVQLIAADGRIVAEARR